MALALDGSVSGVGVSSTTLVLNLTTTNAPGVIVVATYSNFNATAVTSVTATGLVFTSRSTATNTGGNFITEWTAPYTLNFSGNITITYDGATSSAGMAWGISDAATSSYFDTNVSLPVTNTTTTGLISTSNPNDFIYSIIGTTTSSNTPGSGWTAVASNTLQFWIVQYQIVSSLQTNLAETLGSGTAQMSIGDAIIASGIIDTLQSQIWI